MKRQIQIIYGAPTDINLKRASDVAVALGLQEYPMRAREYMKESYKNADDAFIGYDNRKGVGHHRHGSARNAVDFRPNDTIVIDLRDFAEPIRQVQLNDSYTAVIEGGEVVVGCQRFPASKVLELAKMIEKK